jgi:tubulin-folding cofactor B
LYELADDSKMLGYYSVESGMTIHVVDMDPHSMARGGGFEDVSLVEKYTMTDEEYDKRKGTLRAWKKEQISKDPNFKYAHPVLYGVKEGDIPPEEREDWVPPGLETVQGINVGERCEVQPGGRRGTVLWVGEYEGKEKVPKKALGYWVGVKFDEPVGKSDGSNRGVKYFQAPMNFGGFVRGEKVKTGDFPERDLLDMSDSEEEI